MLKKVLKIVAQYIKKLDKPLFIAVCTLAVFSVILMYSLYKNGYMDRSARLYQVQAAAVCLGIFAALFIAALDYNKFIKLWFLYAPATVGATLLTFTALGYSSYEISETFAWLYIERDGVVLITLQPSEIMKGAFILSFALHLSKVGDRLNNPLNIMLLCLHGAAPTLLCVAQRDHGTGIVFMTIFTAMIFAAGISWKYIIAAIIALPPALWIIWERFIYSYQRLRIQALWHDDPMSDPALSVVYYQQHWGRIALGSGQLFGKGLFADEYVHVPEAHNDFILSYVGQCFGFIGCVGLIAVLTYVCMKILANSRIAKDDTGKFICIGVYAMFFVHFVLNIGMVLTVLPVIGIPLLLISQGGTSMLNSFICIGLVLSVYSHSEKHYSIFYDAK